jgi:rod shape-determining protein MreD
MLARQFSISSLVFVIIFLIQESVINQLRLPGGGFSLPLLIALTWAALSTPTVGALTGFISGFLMDLSQSSNGAMGHWTLLMILACYAVAFLGFGNDNVRGNPITNVLSSFRSICTYSHSFCNHWISSWSISRKFF